MRESTFICLEEKELSPITIEQAEDFAELAGAYPDDFGKWIFRDSDSLCKFADLLMATQFTEINNLNAMVQMLKTELAAAETEITALRTR